MRKKKIGSVFTGLLVGGVIGTAVGVLLAPNSGEETRDKIKDEVMGAQQKAKMAVQEARDKTQGALENAKGMATRRKKALAESASA